MTVTPDDTSPGRAVEEPSLLLPGPLHGGATMTDDDRYDRMQQAFDELRRLEREWGVTYDEEKA